MPDQTDPPRKRRRRARGGSGPTALVQKDFRQPSRLFAPVDLASSEAIDQIHNASLEVLSKTGIKVLHEGARSIMHEAGADVDNSTLHVHFDEQLIEKQLATVPPQFTLHARNSAHNVAVGGNQLLLGLMASAPNCSCLDHGRRTGNQKDYRNLLKLGQLHNILHFLGGYPVEPTDIHPSVRHLDCISDFITLTDKTYCIYSLGHERVTDAIEMTRIARGVTSEQLAREPSVFTIINTCLLYTSPSPRDRTRSRMPSSA